MQNPFGKPEKFARSWIEAYWDDMLGYLEEIGHPEWMPKQLVRRTVSDVPGQQFLFSQRHHIGVKKLKKRIGCGMFGCVYTTHDPNVIFKVTLDESEAKIAHFMSGNFSQQFWSQGLVRYYKVFKLPETDTTKNECYRDARGNAYFIWREEVDILGRFKVEKWMRKLFGGMETDEAKRLILSAFSYSRDLQESVCVKKKRMGKEEFYDWSRKLYGAIIKNQEPPDAVVERELSNLHDLYENMINNIITEEIGVLLTTWLDNFAIFSADIHPDNIGVIKGSEGIIDKLIVTDPGFTNSFLQEFDELEVPMI